ncbi:LuxR C-terminal-related transcriptional regulator [Gramella jeungdoensis]|uniref:LuxR C-terminal-related transcriptional regulator n=1 Tax=Gramella jeungdoensis TaxID=708091 RepID=A0ABT0Z155_9FLAO|nr:LuxR C-terminal-related transcriptional regulator [Gramella jeungdoensis]MCM8569010.1 LuxR C-terminal-related transcriptional regulator [Gramella jeungdoensis]
MKVYSFKSLILLVLMVNFSHSQELVPPIQNYTPAEYSAASQNWDISVDERGVVYTANNQGLMVFDGLSWELFPLESQSIIRSVYPYNGRIYTGSFQEFGYWETTEEGCMIYNSLTPLMKGLDMNNDEFWEITSYQDAIYFRSFGGVYKYKDNKITKVRDMVSTALAKFNGRLLFAQRRNGLVYLDDSGALQALSGNLDLIKDESIIDMEASGDTLYLGAREALYFYSDNRLKKFWNTALNALIAKWELNNIISVSENEIVFGTIKNGIIHYNIREDQFQVYDRTSGLQNNTVLGVAYAKDRLWLALDKGVDQIDLNAPIKFYTDNTGELGAVYDLQIYKGNYYLASNTGVYMFSGGKLELIENAADHAWSLEVIDDVLYANHNTGIYKIVNNKFIPVESRTGSFSIKKVDGRDDLLVSHYTGLSLYNPGSGDIRELQAVNFPVKEVVFDGKDRIWAAHPYEGIYKLNPNDWEDIQVEKIPPLGSNENYSPKIYRINDQVIIYVDGEWYKYNPFKDDFEDFEELTAYDDCSLIFKGGSDYVFIDSEDGSLIITDLRDKKLSISEKKFNNRLVKGNENFIRLNDSISFVTLNDGFARVNLEKLQKEIEDQWISTPFLKEFSDEVQRYSLDESPVIPFQNAKNIILKAGLPVSEATQLRYVLDGEEKLTGSLNGGQVNFRNLRHGDYDLRLSAIGGPLNQVSTENFHFTIAPPWYFSTWMKAIYAFLFISIFFLIYWLNQQKLKKHQLQLEEKFEKEHTERLNRLEKQQLMNEIDLKRKELANTTMMAAKKNEVLMEIQGELNKDKSKFSNQFRIKHIMNKINSAVKNKDEWKVFETNFNEVHEDFFKDLLDQYPKLTSKDLKLCSYLKMNLSSKEIAPLMGISVRGVEVHRYRLRKKMKLESDVNLTKFLIRNF